MAVQVQELIDKIKNEGVEAAKKDAEAILTDARAKAQAIITEAQAEAKELVSRSRAEIAKEALAGKDALAQASRDLLLLLSKEIQKLLDRLVLRELKAAYSPDALKQILPTLVSSWKKSQSDELSIILSAEDLAKLESFFAEKLKAELAQGLEIKPAAGIKQGFKILEKSGAAYYDYSAESLAELLSRHLNPALAEVMKKAAAGQ